MGSAYRKGTFETGERDRKQSIGNNSWLKILARKYFLHTSYTVLVFPVLDLWQLFLSLPRSLHRSISAGCLLSVFCSKLNVLILNKRLKPLLEVLNRQFLTLPILLHAIDLFGWDDDTLDNLNDAVCCDAILDNHCSESVDFDADQAAIASDVNSQRPALKNGWKVNLLICKYALAIQEMWPYVEDTLGNTLLIDRLSCVVGIRVQSMIGYDMIPKQRP